MSEPSALDQAIVRIEKLLIQDADPRYPTPAADAPWDEKRRHYRGLLFAENGNREGINHVCKAWILTCNIQLTDQLSKNLFMDRLEFGLKLARWVKSIGFNHGEKSRDELLDWLLIQSWPELGYSLWRDDIFPGYT